MKDELLIVGFLYGGWGVHACMVLQLRLHVGGRSLQIGLISQNICTLEYHIVADLRLGHTRLTFETLPAAVRAK